MVPELNNVGQRSTAKSYCPVSFLYIAIKIFKNLVVNRLVDCLGNAACFLTSSLVSGLFQQVQTL